MIVFRTCVLIIITGLSGCVYTSPTLFPETGNYVYSIRVSISTGSVIPKYLSSTQSLKFFLNVTSEAGSNSIRIAFSEQQHTIYNTESINESEGIFKATVDDVSKVLTLPYVVNYHHGGSIISVNFTEGDLTWSMNIKRAIAASLQMQTVRKPFLGAFKLEEPCLHGRCVVEYSSSDGIEIRRSNSVPTLKPSLTHDLWMSVMTNNCTADTKNPLIGGADRWYTMDEKGLAKMVSKGNIQVHYHNHIFQSLTHIQLERIDITNVTAIDDVSFSIQSDVAYQHPSRHEPTGGRSPQNPSNQLEQLWNTLGSIADGLEQPGLTDTFLKDKLPLRLQEIMSTLTYDTLNKAYKELQLGTSYKWETMKNIYLEVLPQAKSNSSLLLVRDLIVDKKITDTATILQLLRKIPFNIADLSQNLLVEMESLLKLNLDFPMEVRHAAILSFSTLVYKTFINNRSTNDTFEGYVQMYFSRFTESPDYADRLVWLSGLSNLQLQPVTTYLAPVISGSLGHSTNERFLAVWATMPIAHLYGTEIHNTYWPILHNVAEALEMRVAAITMLILAEPTPHRLLSIHWYIISQNNQHLTNFFYTTIKSLEKTTFDCYKHLAKLTSYLGKIVRRPTNQTKLWGTGNYLLDLADPSRDLGIMLQTLLIANPLTSLPEIFYFKILTHNAGLIVQDYAIFMKLQGFANNILRKLHTINAASIKIPELLAVLSHLKVQPQPIQPIHIELIIKYQGKAISAIHFNQTTFNKLTEGDIKKTIDDFLQAESHINQQILIYPTILKSTLPSELGTPVITDTILSSLTSIRGNLTSSNNNDELSRRNDIHLRTSTLALLSLASYNPIADTHHFAEVAQVSDAYFPANFTVTLSISKRSMRTSWLNPGTGKSPRFAAYSHARVAMAMNKDVILGDFCPSCRDEMATSGDKFIMSSFPGMDLKCNGPATLSELTWQLVTSHKSNANILPLAKPWLIFLHGLILGAIPAKGMCKLEISSSNYVNLPQRTDTEIELLANTEIPNKYLFKISIYKTDDRYELISIFNTTTSLEWRDGIKVSLKGTDSKNWKICFLAEENYEHDIRDLETRDNLIESHVNLAFGTSQSTCPINGTLLNITLNPKYTKNFIESYNIQIQMKNIPDDVSTTLNKYSSVFDVLGSESTFFALDLLKLLSKELSQNDASINVNVTLKDDHSKMVFSGKNHTALDVWDMNEQFWFLNPKGYRQFNKDIGFITECTIKPDEILNVDAKYVNISSVSKCQLVAVADCTKTPKFAVIKLPSEHGLAIRFYTGGNYMEVMPDVTGELKVSVNDQQINWQPSYQFPEQEKFYDFKITGYGNNIKVVSKITSTTLFYQSDEAIISMPTTHLSISCGACVSTENLYTEC